MKLEHYFDAIRSAHEGELPLDAEQKKALRHNYIAPLWIIAGPGTGKTHTLVWLVLKRILVDDILPERAFVTTFTRKAAAELESRLIISRQKLINNGFAEAKAIDIPKMKIGTLHGLCSRILQDQRYDLTLRIRLLEDELVQQFFVRRSRNPLMECADIRFWSRFGMANPRDSHPPSSAKRADGACKLFNRMTENSVDVDAMFSSGDPDFERLADAYFRYQQSLRDSHRTDQAHLQQHFLEFLATPAGEALVADGFTVLVDEYQDTNPVQEQIYFRLAGEHGDLTVVGDDDQSLYRFRGATVESLIDFDRACQIYLSKKPVPVYLHENRRSHPEIVEWINRFIKYHPEMHDPRIRVRAPSKHDLKAESGIDGDYRAVMAIIERDNRAAAAKMVAIIDELMSKKMLTDYIQIALLTFSTRETTHGISAYTQALTAEGIPFYNPRNKRAQKDERLMAMVGALSQVLDPTFAITTLPRQLPKDVPDYITRARAEFTRLVDSGSYPELNQYVEASMEAVRRSTLDPAKTANRLKRAAGRRVTLSGLLYKLLGLEPFATDLTDPVGGERFKALNLILAEYESLYDDGYLKIENDPAGGTRIERWAPYNFYAIFIEGIHDGLNDPEDQEVSVLDGMVNVMTIHQSKGLQFEVVFVLRPDKQPFLSDTHVMEDELEPFITRPTKPARRPQDMRAAEDTIRLFFVAYSRAKRLLVLTGCNLKDWDRVLGRAKDGKPINTETRLLAQGVQLV
ncbi:MAG TPA: ATP-dependent helicase [Pyrinomonadaceae bacterium]|nr:ATP-dependent helicase [Pyrinomonadaceae bacterium]